MPFYKSQYIVYPVIEASQYDNRLSDAVLAAIYWITVRIILYIYDIILKNIILNIIGLYCLQSALTICAAVHILITTLALNVFAPALSLHGPTGSMAKATSGMRSTHVLFYYHYLDIEYIIMFVL